MATDELIRTICKDILGCKMPKANDALMLLERLEAATNEMRYIAENWDWDAINCNAYKINGEYNHADFNILQAIHIKLGHVEKALRCYYDYTMHPCCNRFQYNDAIKQANTIKDAMCIIEALQWVITCKRIK